MSTEVKQRGKISNTLHQNYNQDSCEKNSSLALRSAHEEGFGECGSGKQARERLRQETMCVCVSAFAPLLSVCASDFFMKSKLLYELQRANHIDVKRRPGDSSRLKTIPAHSFSPYRLPSVLTTAVLY